jgi:hypothetical protein
MDTRALTSVLTWGTVAGSILAAIGVRRAWRAGHHRLALGPVWLFIAGVFVVPFVFGFLGLTARAAWILRGIVPLAALFGVFLFVRFAPPNASRNSE